MTGEKKSNSEQEAEEPLEENNEAELQKVISASSAVPPCESPAPDLQPKSDWMELWP